MLKSRILKLAVALTILAGSATGLGFASAGSAAAAPASCKTNEFNIGQVTFTYCTGIRSKLGCFTSNNGPIHGPLYAANGCQTQLYLYLGHTLTGVPALCVNPEQSTTVLKKYYEEFVVTSHQGRCGT